VDERILIIEDDEEILRVLNRVLTYEGYFVDTALTGVAGLTIAGEQRPDLVILDWMLPKMDGLEVCRRLQQIGNQPILMLTAKDTLQDRVEGLDAGADDYVSSPLKLKNYSPGLGLYYAEQQQIA
jgi:DNA-binding response OmpR family regulator